MKHGAWTCDVCRRSMHIHSQASHVVGKSHTTKAASLTTPRPGPSNSSSPPSPDPTNASTKERKKGHVYGSIDVHDRMVTFIYGGLLETGIPQIERMERKAADGLKHVAWPWPAHLKDQAPRRKSKKKSSGMVGKKGKTDKKGSGQTKAKSAKPQESSTRVTSKENIPAGGKVGMLFRSAKVATASH